MLCAVQTLIIFLIKKEKKRILKNNKTHNSSQMKRIFDGETFFFTSDPDVTILNIPIVAENGKQAMPASYAVTIFGGNVVPEYDPQIVTVVVISPQKVCQPSSHILSLSFFHTCALYSKFSSMSSRESESLE